MKESAKKLTLTYDDPVVAVFLRMLAWECCVAEKKMTVGGLVENEVQLARRDLGLKPTHGGAPHKFLQELRQGPNPSLSAANTQPFPIHEGWKDDWRLHYVPSHAEVRRLSRNPVVKIGNTDQPVSFSLTLRNPALARLKVLVGSGPPKATDFEMSRGLYFLREKGCLYLGKTSQFHTRSDSHKNSGKKAVLWWVFVMPEEGTESLAADSLAAAESLLISFWNEVASVSNRKRGLAKDQRPTFPYLQQGILLAGAASAAFLWLLREKTELGFEEWSIPFKSGRKKPHGWPACYTEVPPV